MFKKILNEILLSHKPSKGIYKLLETGQINEIIPELLKLKGFEQKTPYHDKDVLEHTMAVVDSIEPRLTLRMAALLHDISKPDCFTVDEKGRGHFYGHHIRSAEESEKILKRLGYDDDFISDVYILIKYHYIKDISSSIKEKGINKFIKSVGEHRIDDMLKLVVADMMGKPDNAGNMEVVDKLKELIKQYKQ
ncbi:HD domain-containing protein [Sedimentibacter hydroxybenzoicus DSM 7310]|uniref:HD domain-containing protein n=1 Tax=Sedimentibacter hydroxybenzoicus DSM 7310 TaxID=1123245 RepID=A0A974GUR5_SEDHY|nr:HD domain-containing protein [Sedimentibacter hydroxybenzoicus]NYB72532.1 HD domain-containing protein [Sedimentibacter hydroxybenzoicus DSM 7310]